MLLMESSKVLTFFYLGIKQESIFRVDINVALFTSQLSPALALILSFSFSLSRSLTLSLSTNETRENFNQETFN